MQDAKEEIRARLSVEDVIGQYVELKKSGRNLKALSPFSSEKTPSFMVSPEKGIWHDFSSNKGGDIFTFVMEVEGMSFREALEHLANKAGIDLSQYSSGPSSSLTQKRKRLIEINKLAEKYYQHTLTKNRHAWEYVFYKRNINRKTIEEFKIGYSPNNGRALVDFLEKQGFTNQEIGEAGLTNSYRKDLFRGRMMVALMDSTGQTIGFTARQIDNEPNSPKYINTSQTLLYDKSRHVFGLSQAKDAIRKSNYAVLVEGNLDVVSSHQVGVKQVVATAGTAITEHHLKAISRFASDIRLAFDGDKAGVAATERAIGIAANLGVELSIISQYDGAKDPDELIQKDPELWKKAINQHEPAVDWLLSQYESKLDLSSASGKREYSTVAINLIDKLYDPIVKDHYLKLVSSKINSSIDALKAKSSLSSPSPTKPKKPIKAVKTEINLESANQDSILALGLYEKTLKHHFAGLTKEDFLGESRQTVFELIENAADKHLDKLPEDIDTYVKVLLLRAEGRYPEWTKEDLSNELGQLLGTMTTEKLKKQKDELDEQLKDAEIQGDHALVDELLIQIGKLNKEINGDRRQKYDTK
jgi:DNA primase, catalytic core